MIQLIHCHHYYIKENIQSLLDIIFLTEIQLDIYHRKHILGMSWRLHWKAISTLHTNHLCPTNDQSFYSEKQHKDN